MKEADGAAARPKDEKCMPLSSTGQGSRIKLVSVEGGRGIKGRLASMGLVPGVEMTVLKKNNRGPLVVAVKESRVMLGRGMAHKIIVKA